MHGEIDKIRTDLEQDTASLTAEQVKSKYLSRQNGIITSLISRIPTLPPEEKKVFAPKIMELRRVAEEKVGTTKSFLEFIDVDLNAPSVAGCRGSLNPVTMVKAQLEEVFSKLGFDILEGPEVDSVQNVFDDLNFPFEHPARDAQDTFYTDRNHVLRTHTSNMQIRYYKTHKPPFKGIVLGKCFRNEALDATHEHTFHQIEGFAVDENISVGNLKWTLEQMFVGLFGEKADEVRFRPSFFPFVEPGFEFDIKMTDSKGNEKWLEWGGCGMIHPNVLENCGIDSKKYRGFAFGFGIERMAIVKYGVSDIRAFFGKDLRFLKQEF
jgi:phenylalanyl-tRNA synthetase alpha chain